MTAAKNLLGCYRKSEANDPEIYTAAIVAVLSMYPLDVIRHVADPRYGLPSTAKWLPTIAELKAACEEAMEPARRQQERDRITRETAQLLLSAPPIPPAQPRAPGTDFDTMFAKHRRPIGAFEEAGDVWNQWGQPGYAARVAEATTAKRTQRTTDEDVAA